MSALLDVLHALPRRARLVLAIVLGTVAFLGSWCCGGADAR